MQSLVAYRSSKLPIACARRARSRPQPLLRLLPFLSVSAPAKSGEAQEPSEEPREGDKPREEKEEKPKEQKGQEPVIDVESSPVVALVTQPSSSGTESASAEPGGETDESQEGASSHPLEDVAEELEEDMIASKELMAEVLDGSAFGKRGELWLLVQAVVIAMVMFPPLTLKGLVDFCATLSLTTGLVFILTAFVHLGRTFSPLPEPRKRHQLVVSGIYGYVRHPMYGGLLLAGFGLAIITRNETRLALVALLWWVLEKKLALEEAALSARYPEYAEYKAKVKKLFPFIY